MGIAVGTWIGVGIASLPVVVIITIMLTVATSDDPSTRVLANGPGMWALALFISTGIVVVGAAVGAAVGGAIGSVARAFRSLSRP